MDDIKKTSLNITFLVFIKKNVFNTINDNKINIEKEWFKIIKKDKIIINNIFLKLGLFSTFSLLKFKIIKKSANKKVSIYDLSSCEYLIWNMFILIKKKPNITDLKLDILYNRYAKIIKEIMLILKTKYLEV